MIQSLEVIDYTLIANVWANGGVRIRTGRDNSGGNGYFKDLIWFHRTMNVANSIEIFVVFIDSNHNINIILSRIERNYAPNSPNWTILISFKRRNSVLSNDCLIDN